MALTNCMTITGSLNARRLKVAKHDVFMSFLPVRGRETPDCRHYIYSQTKNQIYHCTTASRGSNAHETSHSQRTVGSTWLWKFCIHHYRLVVMPHNIRYFQHFVKSCLPPMTPFCKFKNYCSLLCT